MKLKITENQLKLLTESESMDQKKFHKFFAFVFNRISKLNNYDAIPTYQKFTQVIELYDRKYLNNRFFYTLYNENISDSIDWGTSPLIFDNSYDSRQILKLPNNVEIRGGLYLRYGKIENLPDNLNVYSDIDLVGTPISSIGDDIFAEDLLLSNCPNLKKLGNNISVRTLWIAKTNISDIPNNLKIRGDFLVRNTPLSDKYTKDEIISLIKERGGFVEGNVIGVAKYKTGEDTTVWSPKNRASTYTFSNPKTSLLATKFTDYIKSQNEKNEPATRKDFLTKFYPSNVRPGYLSQFFAAIKDAGIVNLNTKNQYSLGQNYEDFIKGKMRKQEYN